MGVDEPSLLLFESEEPPAALVCLGLADHTKVGSNLEA